MSFLHGIGRSLRPGAGQYSNRLSAAEELVAFHDTAMALIEHLDVDSVLQAIVERARALAGTDTGYLYVSEPGDTHLTVRVATGRAAPTVGFRIGRGEGVAGRVWEIGQPVAVDDYSTWSGRMTNLPGPPLHAVCCVPLATAAGIHGVLGLAYNEVGETFGRRRSSF